jgi:hypothetical protein
MEQWGDRAAKQQSNKARMTWLFVLLGSMDALWPWAATDNL